MQRGYLRAQHLATVCRMPQISLGVGFICLQVTIGFNGRKIIFPFFVLYINNAVFFVNSIPLRALRVGITQSNISIPKAIFSNIFTGVPTPIK